MSTPSKYSTASLLAVFFILGIFLGSALVPFSWVEGVPLCAFRSFFGFDCPGCGLSRGFVRFFHGEWFEAFRSNAMTPVIILFLALYGIRHLYYFWRGVEPSWSTPLGQKIIPPLFLILLVFQWFTRNSPLLDSIFQRVLRSPGVF